MNPETVLRLLRPTRASMYRDYYKLCFRTRRLHARIGASFA